MTMEDSAIELAEYLFMRRMSQKEIAAKVGKSEATVSEWVRRFGWREKRAGVRISRHEMVKNMLARIDTLLSEPAGNLNTKEMHRIAQVIKMVDKEMSVVDYIDCFITLGEWLLNHPELWAEVKPLLEGSGERWEAFAKAVVTVQDKFINSMLSNG